MKIKVRTPAMTPGKKLCSHFKTPFKITSTSLHCSRSCLTLLKIFFWKKEMLCFYKWWWLRGLKAMIIDFSFCYENFHHSRHSPYRFPSLLLFLFNELLLLIAWHTCYCSFLCACRGNLIFLLCKKTQFFSMIQKKPFHASPCLSEYIEIEVWTNSLISVISAPH